MQYLKFLLDEKNQTKRLILISSIRVKTYYIIRYRCCSIIIINAIVPSISYENKISFRIKGYLSQVLELCSTRKRDKA